MLHRVFVISDSFEDELTNIKDRYSTAGYPLGFIIEVVKDFKFTRLECLIPKHFFEIPDNKPIIRIRLPFCKSNDIYLERSLEKSVPS